MRNTIATIELAAIQQNYFFAQSLFPQAKIIAVIKADAYGHGAIMVAKSLMNIADIFAVACLEEALELKNHGINNPILLLEGLFEADEIDLAVVNNFSLVVANFQQIQQLSKINHKLNIFLKYDTGMNRLGFNVTEIYDAFSQLKSHNITLMTHFLDADVENSIYTEQQINQFNIINKQFQVPTTLSNSAGILQQLVKTQNYIRPGIMLYGASPIKKYQKNLQPVMSLTAPIINIKKVPKGNTIGYNAMYQCQQDTLVGTVAIGYADGYPRHAKNNTPVYINGTRAQLVGRVSMDMITIDLTDVPNPKLGDTVELFGKHILINKLAEYADTNAYEILTKISHRVYKEYLTTA